MGGKLRQDIENSYQHGLSTKDEVLILFVF